MLGDVSESESRAAPAAVSAEVDRVVGSIRRAADALRVGSITVGQIIDALEDAATLLGTMKPIEVATVEQLREFPEGSVAILRSGVAFQLFGADAYADTIHERLLEGGPMFIVYTPELGARA